VIRHQVREEPNRTADLFGARSRRAGIGRNVTPETITDALLALAVVGSMLAIGTAYPILLVGVTLTVVAAFGVAFKASTSSAPLRFGKPALVALALAGYTLLQAVPLPMGVLSKVAPLNADVWRRSLLPFDVASPGWASISLDAGASYVEVLKWLVYAAVFALSAWASARRGAEWGIALVFASAVLLSLITVSHGLTSATSVFGIYKPHTNVAPWHLSPLINPNNLAGYLNLGTMCGLGLLVARRPLLPRWMVGLGVATTVGVDVISASRGGVITLPLGVALLAFAMRSPDPDRAENVPTRAFPWLLGAAVGGGAFLALLGATSATWQELYDKNLEKLSMISWTKQLVREHIFFGIGRGAFESVFPAYRALYGNIVFTHAENFPAQWISEWGLPVGLAAMAAFAWLFRPTNMGVRRSSIAAGGWIGALILLAQNMLDLALELPAISIALATVLGALWGDHRRRRVSRADGVTLRWSGSPAAVRALLAGSALLLVTAVAATWSIGVHDVRRDKDELYETLSHLDANDRTAVAGFREELKKAMTRHPAEPYFPLLGAIVARRARDSSPLPWIKRSLERASVNGYAHFLLAEMLATRGAINQSLMEFQFAVKDDPNLSQLAAARAVSMTRDFDELLRSVPAGASGVAALESLAGQMNKPGEAVVRERLQREALSRDPSRPGPHRELARRLVQRIESKDAEACGGETLQACETELKQHVAAIDAALPNRSDAECIRADLLVAKGHAEEGEQLLAARCDLVEDRPACLWERVQVAAKVPGARVLAAAAKDALATGCTSSADCAVLATRIGDFMVQRGDWGGASAYYERSTAEEPTEARWLKVAQTAAHLGSHAQAADALLKVKRLRGRGDPELDAQIQEYRSKALDLVGK